MSNRKWVRSEADPGLLDYVVWRIYNQGDDWPRLILGVNVFGKLEAIRMTHPDQRESVFVPQELVRDAIVLTEAAKLKTRRLNA